MSFIYSALEEGSIFDLLLALFSGIPAGTLSIICYVFSAIALYTIARRRGIHHAWLSWVPVLNCWILGSISDQYQYVVRGQIKSKRKTLLLLNLLQAILTICIVFVSIGILWDLAGTVMHSMEFYQLHPLFKPFLGLLALLLPLICISIAFTVIRFIALYDAFRSLDPNNSVLFLVLSILFSVTEAFFLFFNREKDKGMPPRRDAPQPSNPEPVNQDPPETPNSPENKDDL